MITKFYFLSKNYRYYGCELSSLKTVDFGEVIWRNFWFNIQTKHQGCVSKLNWEYIFFHFQLLEISVSDLQFLFGIGRSCQLADVRVNIVRIVAIVGVVFSKQADLPNVDTLKVGCSW